MIRALVVTVLALLLSPPASALNALLIVNDTGALTAEETTLQNNLTGRGHTVTTRNASATEDTSGQDFIVVAESINSGDVGSKYSTSALPAMLLEAFAWDDWEMVTTPLQPASGNTDEFDVLDETEDLAGGLLESGNPHTWTTDSVNAAWSYTTTMASGGVAVLSAPGASTEIVGFYIPSGGTLDDSSSAAALRVGLGIRNAADTIPNLTAAGEAVLDASIDMLEAELATSSGFPIIHRRNQQQGVFQ